MSGLPETAEERFVDRTVGHVHLRRDSAAGDDGESGDGGGGTKDPSQESKNTSQPGEPGGGGGGGEPLRPGEPGGGGGGEATSWYFCGGLSPVNSLALSGVLAGMGEEHLEVLGEEVLELPGDDTDDFRELGDTDLLSLTSGKRA